MTNRKVIERLRQKNWRIRVKDVHEFALVLNACFDAKIRWRGGDDPVCIDLYFLEYLNSIHFPTRYSGFAWSSNLSGSGENITEWFFQKC